jgi:hypothetical protein
MIQRFFLITTVGVLIGGAIGCGGQKAATPIRVLIVTGGHEFERDPFFNMFDAMEGVTWQEVQHPNAAAMFYPEKSGDYDVLVLYDMYQDITDADKQAFADLIKNGKGVVALHHSIADYNNWPEYEQIIGARYFLKETIENGQTIPPSTYNHDQDINVRVLDTTHPITQGIQDFTIHDETYGGFRVLDTVHPLLETDHPLSGKTLAWCGNYGEGRTVYIQLGHDHFAYENPNYRQLVLQAIRWVNEGSKEK